MTSQELERRRERARMETFVIAQTEGGYRIHSPMSGGGPYLVDLAVPSCTCKDFGSHRSDPGWRCKHVLVVQARYGSPEADDGYERAERAALREGAGDPLPLTSPEANGRSPRMLIKRSVSPDGRIDSLSVEFSCPVASLSEAAGGRAKEILDTQDEVVHAFLERANGLRPSGSPVLREVTSGPEPTSTTAPDPTKAVPAQLLRIGGTDGKWGRRLYLTIQANGRALRLYGNSKQLAEHLERAGYLAYAGNVREGVSLNLPCRILTSESEDGFVRVEEVLASRTIQ